MKLKSNRNELKKKIEFMMEQTDDIDELEKLAKIRGELTLVNNVTFKDIAKIVGGATVSIAVLAFERKDIITTKAFTIGTRMMDWYPSLFSKERLWKI